MNVPPRSELGPTPVDPTAIALVYHGNPERDRGLSHVIEAMRSVEPRFTLTLMLTGSEAERAHLRDLASDLKHVHFIAAVPVDEVPATINRFDLEVIFFPPVIENLRFVLPNKLFEAIQARLGVVIGPSEEMVAILDRFPAGAVAGGWMPEDLAGTINSLTASDVERFKAAAGDAALTLNADSEGNRFRAALGIGSPLSKDS